MQVACVRLDDVALQGRWQIANFTKNPLPKLWLWVIMIKKCWVAWYPLNTHSFIKAHISSPSKCLSILKVWFIIYCNELYQHDAAWVCVWQGAQTFHTGVFNLCMFFPHSCNCVNKNIHFHICTAPSVPGGAICYLVTLPESNLCQRQESTVTFVIYMTLMLSYSPPPRLSNACW